jgi:hypothetical protein
MYSCCLLHDPALSGHFINLTYFLHFLLFLLLLISIYFSHLFAQPLTFIICPTSIFLEGAAATPPRAPARLHERFGLNACFLEDILSPYPLHEINLQPSCTDFSSDSRFMSWHGSLQFAT